MKLDYLELGFENCEIARIPGKYIGNFHVGNLETTYRRIGCNVIHKVDDCHEFAVEIHQDADMQTYTYAWEGSGEHRSLFERIQSYPDITSIEFSIDGEKTYFWTDYDEESSNPPQKTYVSKLGHMYLVIGEKTRLNDFFDREEINDAEYMDFHFDMCDVGDANQRDYNISDDEP